MAVPADVELALNVDLIQLISPRRLNELHPLLLFLSLIHFSFLVCVSLRHSVGEQPSTPAGRQDEWETVGGQRSVQEETAQRHHWCVVDVWRWRWVLFSTVLTEKKCKLTKCHIWRLEKLGGVDFDQFSYKCNSQR